MVLSGEVRGGVAHTPNTADGRELSTHTQVRGPSSAAGQNLKCQKDSKHTANLESGGNMKLTRLRGTAVSQAPTSTGRHSGEGRSRLPTAHAGRAAIRVDPATADSDARHFD